MKEIIKLEDYITASGKYPERLNHKELTSEIKDNARKLLAVVNQLLADLKIDKVKVSSGWRPSDVNAAIPNAAKKSLHMQSLAVDLSDPDGKIDAIMKAEADKGDKSLFVKYDCWLESPENTGGWCHTDISPTRPKRSVRIFKP